MGTKVSSNVNFSVFNDLKRAQYTGVIHKENYMTGDWSLIKPDFHTMIGHYTFVGKK